MRKKTLGSALLVAVLTFGAPGDARAGCLTMSMDCMAWALAQESYWDMLWAIDLCQWFYMECMKEKLLGL
jgi:hypothetical protein